MKDTYIMSDRQLLTDTEKATLISLGFTYVEPQTQVWDDPSENPRQVAYYHNRPHFYQISAEEIGSGAASRLVPVWDGLTQTYQKIPVGTKVYRAGFCHWVTFDLGVIISFLKERDSL